MIHLLVTQEPEINHTALIVSPQMLLVLPDQDVITHRHLHQRFITMFSEQTQRKQEITYNYLLEVKVMLLPKLNRPGRNMLHVPPLTSADLQTGTPHGHR